MLTFTAEQIVSEAVEWFGSLGQWPEISVQDMIRTNHKAKTETAAYYGVQAALLMLVAVNESKWPPMPPLAFANELASDSGPLVRYAKDIMITEATA